MITETVKHISDYFDHDIQSRIDYEMKPLRKKFVIEFCDDENKLNLCGTKKEYGDGYWEIDDCYHSVTFEETQDDKGKSFDGTVIERYLFDLFNNGIYDVKFYEQIWDGIDMLQERWIEFPATFYHEFAKFVVRDVMESRDLLRKQVNALQKEVDLMCGFIEKYNAKNAFEEYKQEAV